MINGVAAMIHRIAQNDAEFSGKRVGDHGLALDQPGIAVARFLSCLLPIDENDVAVALLQMQRDADSHNSSSEDDYIGARAHPCPHMLSRKAAIGASVAKYRMDIFKPGHKPGHPAPLLWRRRDIYASDDAAAKAEAEDLYRTDTAQRTLTYFYLCDSTGRSVYESMGKATR